MRNFLSNPKTYGSAVGALFAANVVLSFIDAVPITVLLVVWAVALVLALVGTAVKLRRDASRAEEKLVADEVAQHLAECGECSEEVDLSHENLDVSAEDTFTLELDLDTPGTKVVKASPKKKAPARKARPKKAPAKAAKKTSTKKKAGRRK